MPQLFNRELIFTFLLLASQPHTNLLFTSQGHFTFTPSTTQVRGIQNEPHPEAERVQQDLCHQEGDWTVPGLSSLEAGQEVTFMHHYNHMPRTVPGTLGIKKCEQSHVM